MKLLITTLFIVSSWAMASEPHDHDGHSDTMHHSHKGIFTMNWLMVKSLR